MTMNLQAWASTLSAAATRTLGPDPIIPAPGAIRDERGSTLAVDWVYFAAIAGVPAPIASERGTVAGAPSLASLGPDELLWAVCAGVELDVDALLGPSADGSSPVPLFAQAGRYEAAIEVYTERLLCATHALHRLARVRARPDWHARAVLCARWLLEHLQPDNATNYPWAVHVMARLALTDDPSVPASTRAAADMYAQTLLHNCQVMHGRADVRSAWILWDAAGELRSGTA
jgi:hypothetical protein